MLFLVIDITPINSLSPCLLCAILCGANQPYIAGPAVHVALKSCHQIKQPLMQRTCCYPEDHLHCMQEWEYPRENLIYLRELGEGQYGKVHLMKAKVS